MANIDKSIGVEAGRKLTSLLAEQQRLVRDEGMSPAEAQDELLSRAIDLDGKRALEEKHRVRNLMTQEQRTATWERVMSRATDREKRAGAYSDVDPAISKNWD